MKPGSQQTLASFRELPEPQKHEVAAEVLRWWRQAEQPALDDVDLTAAAAAVFRLYDEDEQRSELAEAR